MSYRGKVKNGVVVFSRRQKLPEGTLVIIRPVGKSPKSPSNGTTAKTPAKKRIPKRRNTLGEKLLKFAGVVTDLPPDFARNHDHYLHGQPKR